MTIIVANEYHTSGRWILDSNNTRLMIRGVSKPGLEYLYLDLPTMIPETIAFDLNMMESWGFNAVRLPLRDAHWLQRQDYRDKVDEWVTQIRLRGMLVILDFHLQRDHPGQDGFMLRSAAGEDGLRLWIQLSEKYKDPSIFFELFNEPFQVDPSTWWYGNETYYGYRDVLKEVRKRSNNICILGGMDYAYQWSFLRDRQDIVDEMRSFPNLVLSTHPYGYRGAPSPDHVHTVPIPVRKESTGGCTVTIPSVPRIEYGWDESFGFLLQEEQFPLLATEWGLDRPDTAVEGGWYNTHLLEYMTDRNMSHVAWAWVQERLDYPSLLDRNFQPTGEAMIRGGRACASLTNNFYQGPGQLVQKNMHRQLTSENPHPIFYYGLLFLLLLCFLSICRYLPWMESSSLPLSTSSCSPSNNSLGTKSKSSSHLHIRIRSSPTLAEI